MTTASILHDLETLRAAGAARVDAVGWHYIETLAQRTQAQSGTAQSLLLVKLQGALAEFKGRIKSAAAPQAETALGPVPPSPMSVLLQDMGSPTAPQGAGKTAGQLAETPRIQQFRKQLSQISVHKQVTQAIAQAPQNAGPINSHMLVLRSLGLMRDISPDYLNRFMGYVDTLLCLDEAGVSKAAPRRTASASVSKK
jgi:hypothetical protein